jgi:hypothetical protein
VVVTTFSRSFIAHPSGWKQSPFLLSCYVFSNKLVLS